MRNRISLFVLTSLLLVMTMFVPSISSASDGSRTYTAEIAGISRNCSGGGTLVLVDVEGKIFTFTKSQGQEWNMRKGQTVTVTAADIPDESVPLRTFTVDKDPWNAEVRINGKEAVYTGYVSRVNWNDNGGGSFTLWGLPDKVFTFDRKQEKRLDIDLWINDHIEVVVSPTDDTDVPLKELKLL